MTDRWSRFDPWRHVEPVEWADGTWLAELVDPGGAPPIRITGDSPEEAEDSLYAMALERLPWVPGQ